MSRIPAALIVCGVCVTALYPGGHAISAETSGIYDQTRPVRLAAQENKPSEGKPPALPTRKPRKPVDRKTAGSKKTGAQKTLSRSARDKYLCKALQSCRNEFVRCKNKIKHPDQSEEWIIAKEVCGAYYKTCVEKDFKSGEWFFTRWFYFKKLDCS